MLARRVDAPSLKVECAQAVVGSRDVPVVACEVGQCRCPFGGGEAVGVAATEHHNHDPGVEEPALDLEVGRGLENALRFVEGRCSRVRLVPHAESVCVCDEGAAALLGPRRQGSKRSGEGGDLVRHQEFI